MPLPPHVERALAAVRRRIRLQRALDAGVVLLVAGLGIAAIGLALSRAGVIDQAERSWLAVALALPALGVLIGLLRRVPRLLPAQLLDRSHALASRLANAIELAASPERTPFMEAAIADAEVHAKGLDPKRAMPLRAPRDLVPAFVLGLAVTGLSFLRVFQPPPPEPVVAELAPLLIDDDALDGFAASLEPVLRDRETSDDVRQAARALNQVLEDMADRRLDRTEALRRLQQIEQQLTQGRPATAEQVREQLQEMGRELQRASLTQAASEALRDGDAARAADAMRELATRLETETPSRQELDRLRQALDRASRDDEQRRLDELRQQREELQRLLQRQREQQQTETEEERRLLRRRERQLERLQREEQQLEEQRRQLDRLRREMQQAAEELNRDARDRQQQSEAMQRLAEELNRMAREQMSEEQRRELQRQMQQLREMIRRMQEQQQQQQGGQGGQDGQQQQQGQGQGQGQRLQRFVLQAGGGQGNVRLRMPGQQGQQGQGQGQQGQGQGQQGQGQGQQGQGQGQQGQGQGQQGQGQGQGGQQGQGQGQDGQGQGQAGGQGQGQGQGGQGQGQGEQVVELTPGGQGGNAVLELPGMGGGQGQQGQGQGQGTDPGGSQAGTGHDPNLFDDATALRGNRQNTRVSGQESDQGPSRSEVILGAANRGFVGQGYRQVFTDYAGHAEEVLERDEVPPGYRFYVRRYFQLIRPRDGAPAQPAE
ncbi:MAG: OmpH family outer membrane protein [Myxococcales bacterium]|nr:OmpH family outer membrane protein [Myxococcales bacterium]